MVVSKMRLLALQKGLKVSASAWELSEQHIGIGDYDATILKNTSQG